ncbi:MAG: phosphotransferase family protein, partial [Dehalococcoidia bacterium]
YVAEWLPGPSLASVPANEPVDAIAIGRTLHKFHRIRPPDGLRDTRQWLHPDRVALWRHLPLAMQALGERLAVTLHAYHPPVPVLVHGDLAPTNVLLTDDGPRFIDPVGFRGLSAWDVAQLAVSSEGRGRRGMLPALMGGYGEEVPHIEEMVGWMVLHYLDKNLAVSDSPFTQHLQPLAESLIAAADVTAFLKRYISSGRSSR